MLDFSMSKRTAIIAAMAMLSFPACAPAEETPQPSVTQAETPPPIPEGQETVAFERETSPEIEKTAEQATTEETATPAPPASPYWGIEPGEPLPIMWDDLMPEGSEEEMLRQQDEFYRMLEQRYMANSSRLADAAPLDGIEEGSELDFMPQFGTFDTVEEFDGQLIRIPGYVVPFDFNLRRRHDSFLLVPYMGACIHTPPPPPNQIIYVRADPSIRIKDIWVPYWLEGDLQSEQVLNDTGDAAYSLALSKIEPYPIP
ncbi:DUF3299 domain-containing protein [Hyphomonas sp. FCG-A18]|uniref:DUF3299 domain-containing protein n=1 Tax=Hyphomonas sp. FCG-A18 TaxID=3080019 RepID=UPI002B2B313D|nr:DUF3299 domain-containing protein [Hyphomonas sp. FCG-A18]